MFIIDREKYEIEYLETLSNPVFYGELPSDLIPSYRQTIHETIDILPSDQIIDEFEAEQMKDGIHSCCFYGLPKSHKSLILFLHSDQSVVVLNLKD